MRRALALAIVAALAATPAAAPAKSAGPAKSYPSAAAKKRAAARSACLRRAKTRKARQKCVAAAARKPVANQPVVEAPAPKKPATAPVVAPPFAPGPVSPPLIAPAPADPVLPPVAAAPACDPSPWLLATADDAGGVFRLRLSRSCVPAGKVLLNYVNRDAQPHNLWVEGVSPRAPARQVIGDVDGPGSGTGSVTLEAGTWRIFCAVEGHEVMTKNIEVTLQ